MLTDVWIRCFHSYVLTQLPVPNTLYSQQLNTWMQMHIPT